MSYSAYVPCRCHEEGRTTLPPTPVIWNAEDGLWEAAPDSDVNWGEVYQWRKTACPHQGMHFVHEWVANSAGMSALHVSASELNLTALAAALPTHNGGFVPPEEVKRILPELDVLEHTPLMQTFVQNTTGRALWSAPGLDGNWVRMHKGTLCGFDAQGVFVQQNGLEVFRSGHFQQQPGQDSWATYTALDGPDQTELGHLFNFEDGTAPDELRVISEIRPSESNAWQAQTLRKLCYAALEMQKPIYWT